MASNSPRWDIGEEVVVRTSAGRPLAGAIAASSMKIVFGVLALAGVSFRGTTIANRASVLELIRVERKDVQRETRTGRRKGDTQQGISTARLAAIFPSIFKPSEGEDDTEPFFMS